MDLAHDDKQGVLFIICDASPFGVGVVLSHIPPDDTEAPTAFYSRTLTSTER